MCDVIFITPNINDSIRQESMGTLLLATILKENGINCEVWNIAKFGDINDFDAFLNNAVLKIEEKQPKIVSFYTRCDFYHVELRLAECIKEKFSDINIVFGGPQADITCEDTIKEIPYVDYICCGEGEKTIYPFLDSILKGEPDLSIDGLVYREGEKIIKNPRPLMHDDSDSLPYIDYSLANCSDTNVDKLFPVEVGRGCPFGCVFCSTKSFWGRKYRLKSSERIFNEIKAINKELGVTRFNFLHDMFTFNRKNIIEICKLLKTLDFPIKWACSARLDCIDQELVDIMVDAGLVHIYFGIESGSPRMQKIINKRLKLDNAVELLDYISQKDIVVTTSFIYGFPEETEEDVLHTMSLIAKLYQMKNIKIQTHLCAFLSETDLTKNYKDFLTPTERFSNIIGEYAIEECRPLIEAHPKLFDQMYEYKTDLRKKLEYFEIFFIIWGKISHIYNYLSTKYSKDKLLDMYFDFVDDNKEILEEYNSLDPEEIARKVIENDKFALRFTDDEKYDIIFDYYRLERVSHSKEILDGGVSIDTYCFNPNCRKKFLSIADFSREQTVVVCTKGQMTVGLFSK